MTLRMILIVVLTSHGSSLMLYPMILMKMLMRMIPYLKQAHGMASLTHLLQKILLRRLRTDFKRLMMIYHEFMSKIGSQMLLWSSVSSKSSRYLMIDFLLLHHIKQGQALQVYSRFDQNGSQNGLETRLLKPQIMSGKAHLQNGLILQNYRCKKRENLHWRAWELQKLHFHEMIKLRASLQVISFMESEGEAKLEPFLT